MGKAHSPKPPAPPEDAPLSHWEGCTAFELAEAWSLPRVDLHSRVTSTNDLARRAAMSGAPAGTLFLAEQQTAGRGRGRRKWSSPPGLGLYISIVARPRAEQMGPYPLRIGLATAIALDPWCPADPILVKWPNDLLLRGRKIGGVLCEGSWEGGRLDHVVVGIGLNLLQHPTDFPEEFRGAATALRETGVPVSRFEVATRVLSWIRPIVMNDGDEPEWLDSLTQRDALRGRRVQLLEPDSGRLLAVGKAQGIDADGSFLLRDSSQMHVVRSGTIRLALPADA